MRNRIVFGLALLNFGLLGLGLVAAPAKADMGWADCCRNAVGGPAQCCDNCCWWDRCDKSSDCQTTIS